MRVVLLASSADICIVFDGMARVRFRHGWFGRLHAIPQECARAFVKAVPSETFPKIYAEFNNLVKVRD